MGSLGSGNHFIEIDKDSKKNYYLVIHSGSRLLGTQVYSYYMDEGYKLIGDKSYNYINTYIEGELKENYLYDIKIVQQYASLNRRCIAEIISKFLKNKIELVATSVHNYIDLEQKLIRKGAISAQKDEQVIIPINSRDGVILGKGLGNEEWLCSAPHGAGRLYSRGDSKNYFTLHDYKEQMKGIHSISITENNISECPGVYRDIQQLSEEISDNCIEIEEVLAPIYNFKQ